MLRSRIVLGILCAVVGCASARSLPPIPEADEIRVRGLTEEVARIDDRDLILQVVSLANQYPDGWSVPWYGPPVARIKLVFYFGGEPVADLGLGKDFLTRAHANFFSRGVSESVIREFREILNLENPYVE